MRRSGKRKRRNSDLKKDMEKKNERKRIILEKNVKECDKKNVRRTL
jgi:hypothetical protein